MVGGFGEIFSSKGWSKGLDHKIGVGNTDTTTDNATNVTEESFPDFVGKLGHKLVGNNQIEAIFPSLRENRFKTISGEILELVNVETEVLAFALGDILTRHSGLLELHYENHTEKVRIDITEFTFGEVDEEDFFAIHDFTDIKAGFNLTEGVSHDGISEERAPFGSEPGGDFAGVTGFLRCREFFGPVVINGFIGDVFEFGFNKFGVGETLRNINKGGASGVRHQEKSGVPEHMLATGAKEALIIGVKQRLEHANSLLDDEVFLVVSGKFKHIHADRMLDIRGIKVNHIINAFLWNAFQNSFDGIAVRINKGKAPAIAHILEGDVLEEDRFTHTSLTDDVHMTTAVIVIEVDGFLDAPEFIGTEQYPFGSEFGWPINLFSELTLYL